MATFLVIWRVGLVAGNVLCVLLLLVRFFQHRKEWDTVTRDYWWTLVLWSVAAIAIGTQGLIEHRKLTIGLVFVSIAAAATPLGLKRKEELRRAGIEKRRREAENLS